MVPKNISNEETENWFENLWEDFRKAKEKREKKGKAPIIKTDLESNVDFVTRYEKKVTNAC